MVLPAKGMPYMRTLTVGLLELTLMMLNLVKQLPISMFNFQPMEKRKEQKDGNW